MMYGQKFQGDLILQQNKMQLVAFQNIPYPLDVSIFDMSPAFDVGHIELTQISKHLDRVE